MLVHYVGDNSLAEDYSHGSTKTDTRFFTHTCPSVLRNLEKTTDLPSKVYKDTIANSSYKVQLQQTLQPRNTTQISNLQQKERQKLHISHDAFYNVHELAYNMDGL